MVTSPVDDAAGGADIDLITPSAASGCRALPIATLSQLADLLVLDTHLDARQRRRAQANGTV